MRVVSFAVVGRDLNFQVRRARDHVLVGHDIPGWVDNESGTETLQRLPDLARTSLVITKKLRIKIFDRIADAPPDHALGVNIDDGRQDLCNCQHSGLSRRIGLGQARCRSYQRQGGGDDRRSPNFSMNSHLCGASNEAASALST